VQYGAYCDAKEAVSAYEMASFARLLQCVDAQNVTNGGANDFAVTDFLRIFANKFAKIGCGSAMQRKQVFL